MRTQISRAFFIGMLVVLMLAVTSPAQPVQAAASDGYDLIAAVNTLRQSKGVAPLAVDGSLMGSAQSHTDYQASMGSWTHTGPGGSTPTSRAVAAGYGGGASVKVLGNFTYFTLNVGYMTAKAGTNPKPSTSSVLVQQQVPTQPLVAPVITSTPKPDGSVTHVVGFGQTLIMIANAYGLKLDELRQRNNLTGDFIYEGQKLIIQGSSTPTLTPTITLTSQPPSYTPRPTRTPTQPPTITPTATATATATPKPFLPSFESIDRQTLGTVILGISGIGLVLVLVSFFRKKKN